MAGKKIVSADSLLLGGTSAMPTTEPKRKYNFLLTINDFINGDYIQLNVRKFPLPEITVKEIPIKYGNEQVFIAGRAEYNAGELEIFDNIDGTVLLTLREWHRKVYDPETGQVNISGKFKRDGRVEQYSPDGVLLQTFDIRGAWISKINYGDVSQEDDGVNTIHATIRYDKAFPRGSASESTGY